MTQLTEERFEQILTEKLKTVATKADLLPLATKEDVRLAVEELARMVADGFEDMRERLDVKERLTLVEQKLHRVEEALHITL